MKIKKTSMIAAVAAVALIAGVTTAFATSAKPDGDTPDAIDTAVQVSTTISYVDAEDGTIWYSFDDGKTFEAMTDEEYDVRFSSVDVEWWTYEEYKEWLENEKAALQSLIGERAWTSGRGEFVWTQEIVDESIAMYESILEDIGNGMLYSKTVNGEADGIVISLNPGDIEAETELSTLTYVAREVE